jgi:hypothetical protein
LIRPVEPDYKPRADVVPKVSASHARAAAVSGIGGWLLLLIIRLWIGTGIRVIGGVAAGLSLLGIFSLGSAALAGVAAYLLGRKSAKGVMVAKIYLVVDGLYYILALLDSMLDGAPQLSGGLPPWFKPSGYLVACVLWLLYLAHSERVKNTYCPADAEDQREPSRRTGWSSTVGPMAQANAEHQEANIPRHPPSATRDLEEITTGLLIRVDERLQEMFNNPVDKHRRHVDLLNEHGSAGDIEKYRRKLLSQVMPLCEHANSIVLSPSPSQIIGTPDSNGSLRKEIQKWSVMAAGMKMSRALDIRAAMEVYKPFECMIEDRAYLLAIVRKNAGEDGTSTGNMDATLYESASGPEIAYRLITQADQDMFESEMWAHVAHYAGDEGFLARYDRVGNAAVSSSLDYWGKQLH